MSQDLSKILLFCFLTSINHYLSDALTGKNKFLAKLVVKLEIPHGAVIKDKGTVGGIRYCEALGEVYWLPNHEGEIETGVKANKSIRCDGHRT
ncbi:hypothetical protein JHK87_042534 [Glycine soja]|nr:hypothetical protein JHK87_042534 [Glycine soja]